MSRSPCAITYAHVPGGGPSGKICAKCAHWVMQDPRMPLGPRVCAKAAGMVRRPLSDLRRCPGGTAACHHWAACPQDGAS